MLLIGNFNPALCGCPEKLLATFSTIAAYLGENELETFVLSVLPVPVPEPQPEPQKGLTNGNGNRNEALSPAPFSVTEAIELKVLKQAQPEPEGTGAIEPEAIRLAYSQADNFNRIGELLLHSLGLKDTQTGWQDAGPVAIIPPTDPILNLFLGHAIVHYLSDSGAWSSLYVVTHLDPLTLQEWD
ncbi:MAG TPA: hypothetical protein VH186_15765 [Chloroflexia bacterium]|nr:hypothetical protein [Chloroflexia bacterium]